MLVNDIWILVIKSVVYYIGTVFFFFFCMEPKHKTIAFFPPFSSLLKSSRPQPRCSAKPRGQGPIVLFNQGYGMDTT